MRAPSAQRGTVTPTSNPNRTRQSGLGSITNSGVFREVELVDETTVRSRLVVLCGDVSAWVASLGALSNSGGSGVASAAAAPGEPRQIGRRGLRTVQRQRDNTGPGHRGKTSSSDAAYGIRVVISPTNCSNAGAGGLRTSDRSPGVRTRRPGRLQLRYLVAFVRALQGSVANRHLRPGRHLCHQRHQGRKCVRSINERDAEGPNAGDRTRCLLQ